MKLHQHTVCVVLVFALALSVEAVHTRTSRRLDSDAEEDNREEAALAQAALMETAQKPVAAPLRRSSRHVRESPPNSVSPGGPHY